MHARSQPQMTLREVVARLLSRYEGDGWAPTLLGVGPVSPLVVRAAVEVGRDADCPVMLVASRNQVDCASFGGGYVEGWTQQSFAADIARLVSESAFDGLCYVCRDHGGPWQRDEELRAAISVKRAMASALESYQADLKAGFHLLHVDPTRDPAGVWPPPAGGLPPGVVIERSVALMQAIEQERTQRGLQPVCYEIGTEEISGGLTAEAGFAAFITNLLGCLTDLRLPSPAFIVGQTGGLLKMRENVGTFNADAARGLAAIARAKGLGFKEHNADYLPADILAAHPELGITAANVAPEFGHVETQALLDLADAEVKAGAEPASGFRQIVEEKTLASGRWRKWLRAAERGATGDDLRRDAARLNEVAVVCGHYVFSDLEVEAARRRLYANAAALGIATDAEREVVDRVKAAIAHYVEPFRLAGLTTWLRAGR